MPQGYLSTRNGMHHAGIHPCCLILVIYSPRNVSTFVFGSFVCAEEKSRLRIAWSLYWTSYIP
jgi:hypothetical protein